MKKLADEADAKEKMELRFLSTVTFVVVPSNGALHRLDSSSSVFATRTSSHWRPRAQHHSFRPSTCSSLCRQVCGTRCRKLGRSVSSRQAHRPLVLRGTVQERHSSYVAWRKRSSRQRQLAGDDSSVHSGAWVASRHVRTRAPSLSRAPKSLQ